MASVVSNSNSTSRFIASVIVDAFGKFTRIDPDIISSSNVNSITKLKDDATYLMNTLGKHIEDICNGNSDYNVFTKKYRGSNVDYNGLYPNHKSGMKNLLEEYCNVTLRSIHGIQKFPFDWSIANHQVEEDDRKNNDRKNNNLELDGDMSNDEYSTDSSSISSMSSSESDDEDTDEVSDEVGDDN